MKEARGITGPDASFLVASLVMVVAFLWIIAPFVVPLLLSASAVAILAPVHEWLFRHVHFRRRLSSILIATAAVLLVAIPTAAVAYFVVKEVAAVIASWRTTLSQGGLDAFLSGRIREPLAPLLRQLDSMGAEKYLRSLLDEAASFLSTHLGAAATLVATLVVKAFVVILGMYYFFLDGPRFFREFIALAPMEARHTQEIAGDMVSLLRALFVASFVTAVIQGILGAIGFWIGGLPNALLWAALMAFLGLVFSLVPIIGTGLVYVPAGIWLLAHDKIFGGIFVLLWGTVVLGSVEYFVKPYFAKERVSIHPLLIFLTLFGGIEVMGPIGALAGPLLAAMVGSFLRVWKRDILPAIAPAGFD